MKNINYRITVNINDRIMKLGFRGQLAREHIGKKIRVQAIFTIRQVDRRFPMEVTVEESDIGPLIRADALIELPYVFLTPPRRKVSVTFALWFGMEEIILDDQPFPVQKELFVRPDQARRKNYPAFAGLTALLPVLLLAKYLTGGRSMEQAKKEVNAFVYARSGIPYSPRQRNTSYFADRYSKEVSRHPGIEKNRVLFLSERSLDEKDNLARIKKVFEADPDLEVHEFLCDRTVDALTRAELSACAAECARASVIILDDFYPQLHSLTIRPETNVVQLWHACGAFKTFGYSHMGKPGGAPQSAMNHRNYDLVCVSSEKVRGIYAEAFAVPYRKVQALGVPRTDDLFDSQYKERTRADLYGKYPACRHKRVVLFAPTFRGEGNKDAFYPADRFDVGRFMEAMPADVFLIIKNHPFVKEGIPVPDHWRSRVLDLSGEEHINDLMMISDLLITDYSSSVFEAAILGLPMAFYAFDLSDYMAGRDFYLDFEEVVPGPVEKSFDGLLLSAAALLGAGEAAGEKAESKKEGEADRIQGLASPGQGLEFKEKADRFREDFLGALDGHSTERICTYIRERLL